MKKLLLIAASVFALNFGFADAAYTPTSNDNSVAVLSNGQSTVSGLTNVLALACGIPINDGATHTVGTAPAGSCFNGKTTLAGLAAITINGTTPFSFLTASGASVGPFCENGGSTNCFTNGVYNLTDGSVANMDIAWLAIQAAIYSRKAYIPAGTYVVGSTEVLPLMVGQEDEYSPGSGTKIIGDGPELTVIKAGHDFGSLSGGSNQGNPLLSCGDPSGTTSNTKGRYTAGETMCTGDLDDIGFISSGTLVPGLGTAPIAMDGVALGGRLRTTDVHSSGFYNDFTFTGSHTLHVRMHAFGGTRNFYWGPQNGDISDLMFIDLRGESASQAAIAISNQTYISATVFDGETFLGTTPYAIFAESGASPQNLMMIDCQFRSLMTEDIGNAAIHDDNVYSGGLGAASTGTYTDSNKSRNVVDLHIDRWYTAAYNDKFWGQSGGRRRRAMIDVNVINGTIAGIQNNGAILFPGADTIGNVYLGLINVNGAGGDAGSFNLSGDMPDLFTDAASAGLPIFPGPTAGLIGNAQGVTWTHPGDAAGVFATFQSQGAVTTTVAGDLMELWASSYNTVVPAGYSATQPVVGVAMQSGQTTGQIIPLQTSGMSLISAGYGSSSQGWEKKSTGVGGRPTFVAGSGATNGSYLITATGGGCSTEPQITAVVTSNHISSITGATTPVSAGCTSAPSFSTSTITGLSGGSITAQWPAAGVVAATGPTDGLVVGFGMTGSVGTSSAGTARNYIRTMNMGSTVPIQ